MGVGGHNFFLLANTYHPTPNTRLPARPHRGRFACKEHPTTAQQPPYKKIIGKRHSFFKYYDYLCKVLAIIHNTNFYEKNTFGYSSIGLVLFVASPERRELEYRKNGREGGILHTIHRENSKDTNGQRVASTESGGACKTRKRKHHRERKERDKRTTGGETRPEDGSVDLRRQQGTRAAEGEELHYGTTHNRRQCW